jgi:hypothetical protein
VPGAPAESLATRSQDPALNDGAEISAPGCVAVALLATRQPPAPRSVRSLAPVPAKALGAALRTAEVTVAAWVTGVPGASKTSDVAAQAIEAPKAKGVRRNRFTAGNS